MIFKNHKLHFEIKFYIPTSFSAKWRIPFTKTSWVETKAVPLVTEVKSLCHNAHFIVPLCNKVPN